MLLIGKVICFTYLGNVMHSPKGFGHLDINIMQVYATDKWADPGFRCICKQRPFIVGFRVFIGDW